MRTTLVVQSHRNPLPYAWLRFCLDTVADWARENDFDYQFVGDELFDPVEPELLEKIGDRRVIATDIARLQLLRQGLANGYECVVWCDADFLIFDPGNFDLPRGDCAFGREIWVQRDDRGGLRAYPKLHNAFLLFRRGNPVLDFYLDTAQRLLRLNQGGMPPQFIGPKLLTALHNIACFPVFDRAGMLSPPVMRDILSGGGPALDLFLQKSPCPPAAANLSSSLIEAESFTQAEMATLIRTLLKDPLPRRKP